MPHVETQDRDRLVVTSDKSPGNIVVSMRDSNLGERTPLLPFGSKLANALTRLHHMTGLHLFWHSEAGCQRDLLYGSQRSRATHALKARSATNEEASLRKNEGEQMPKIVDRARRAHPRGPDAVVYSPGGEIGSDLQRAGIDTQDDDQARVLMACQDGRFVEARPSAHLMLGVSDELVVLPKVETKKIEVTRGILQITWPAGMTARIALGL